MNAEKRTRKAVPLKKNERRADMKIIVSATQKDIYAWAVSLAIMAGVIAIVVTLALMKG